MTAALAGSAARIPAATMHQPIWQILCFMLHEGRHLRPPKANHLQGRCRTVAAPSLDSSAALDLGPPFLANSPFVFPPCSIRGKKLKRYYTLRGVIIRYDPLFSRLFHSRPFAV